MEFDNKRIVITGATSGVGWQLMRLLSRHEKVKIIATGRNVKNIPVANNIIPFREDLSCKEGVDNLFDFALKMMGGIDIFIANAEFFNPVAIDETDWECMDYLFRINTFSVIYSLKKMIALGQNLNPYTFVFSACSASKLPVHYHPIYASTKTAVENFCLNMQPNMPPNGKLLVVYAPVIFKSEFEMLAENRPLNSMPGSKQYSDIAARNIIKAVRNEKDIIYTDSLFKATSYLMSIFPTLRKNTH